MTDLWFDWNDFVLSEVGEKTETTNVSPKLVCNKGEVIKKQVFFGIHKTFKQAKEFCSSIGGDIFSEFQQDMWENC